MSAIVNSSLDRDFGIIDPRIEPRAGYVVAAVRPDSDGKCSSQAQLHRAWLLTTPASLGLEVGCEVLAWIDPATRVYPNYVSWHFEGRDFYLIREADVRAVLTPAQ